MYKVKIHLCPPDKLDQKLGPSTLESSPNTSPPPIQLGNPVVVVNMIILMLAPDIPDLQLSRSTKKLAYHAFQFLRPAFIQPQLTNNQFL